MDRYSRIILKFVISAIIVMPAIQVCSQNLLFECDNILSGFDYTGSNNILHVDNSVSIDVGNDGTTRERAYHTIQRAVNEANDLDVILVWPGIYKEEVHIGSYAESKRLVIMSAADAAVIKPPDPTGYAVTFYGNVNSGTILRNFVISSGQIGIYCSSASPWLVNLTVVDNGVGLVAANNSTPKVYNCIFHGNTFGDIEYYDETPPEIRNSCLEDIMTINDYNNINLNPRFADPQNGDYHLLSRRGRYLSNNFTAGVTERKGWWVLDSISSPCIDAGDPNVFPKFEPMPNGGRINMGAYGGTCYASRSEWPLRGDMNFDGIFDFADFARLAEQWLHRLEWHNNGY